MKILIAIFKIHSRNSRPINEWMEQYDYTSVVRSENLHVFLIRTDESWSTIMDTALINLGPGDHFDLVEHPDPVVIAQTLQWAADWTKERLEN